MGLKSLGTRIGETGSDIEGYGKRVVGLEVREPGLKGMGTGIGVTGSGIKGYRKQDRRYGKRD